MSSRADYDFGLDAELRAKEAAKRDDKTEEMVFHFIQELSGQSVSSFDDLRNGVALCKMMNVVAPGSIKKINESEMPFKQMENIANFLKTCRSALGLQEADVFCVPDLFDDRSPVNVTRGIIAFSRAATKSGFSGPTIAPKEVPKKSIRSSLKRWSLRASRAANSAIPLLNLGSSKTMEKPDLVKQGPTFGATASGPSSAANEISRLNAGSHGIQDKDATYIDRTRDINFGANASGTGSREMSKMGYGSQGVMDPNATHLVRNGPTFGADAGSKVTMSASEDAAADEGIAA
mmetsp:Transcript_23999/g.42315  ORF Transcript_23999/g.42315 Transcript_23999/m.42315 type:complete len:291 (-) Transcript_23999:99-971(-)